MSYKLCIYIYIHWEITNVFETSHLLTSFFYYKRITPNQAWLRIKIQYFIINKYKNKNIRILRQSSSFSYRISILVTSSILCDKHCCKNQLIQFQTFSNTVLKRCSCLRNLKNYFIYEAGKNISKYSQTSCECPQLRVTTLNKISRMWNQCTWKYASC